MNRSAVLYLAVDPDVGRPVALARIVDPAMLQAAGRVAIRSAEKRALDAQRRDEFLGRLYSEEADHLKRYLAQLIPGLTEITQ